MEPCLSTGVPDRWRQRRVLDGRPCPCPVPRRTTGTGARHVAYVPPGWTGTLPDGVDRVDSSTRTAWMLGRTGTNGPKDYVAVHAFQDGMKLTPLSQWGEDWTAAVPPVDPNVDMKTAPSAKVETMSAKAYFEYAAELLKLHPPKSTDYSQVR